MGEGSRTRAAVTYGTVLLLGSVVLSATIALPLDDHREPAALGAVAVGCAALGAVLLVFARSLPAWVLHTVLGASIVMAAIVVRFGGADLAGTDAVGFPLVVVAAFYYFDLTAAAAYALFAAGCYAAALIADDEIPARAIQFVIGAGALAAVALIMVRLRRHTDRLVAELERAARTDPLTGLANRREFDSRFRHELARAERSNRPLGLVLIDIDGFKALNDRLGHEEGDLALRRFGELLCGSVRVTDLAARLGGEEFAVLAPEASPVEALVLAERIREGALEGLVTGGERITVSCGVAAYPAAGTTEDELFRAADEALYAAKRAGRNRSELGSAHEGGERPFTP